MKKLNYFLTVVAGTMMLASCSHDKEVVAPNDNDAVQQIVLQVASNGDGLTTRAGRPLLSDEAAQDIDVVDIYIVTKGTNPVIKVAKPNITWSDATKYDNGKMKTLTLTEDEVLPNGSYTIYALGHTATSKSNYDIPTLAKDANSTLENYVLKYKTSVTNPTPEEIFAGSVELEVKGNFSKAIVLNRQVAGAYFYVYNLPKVDNLTKDCELQLVASDCNDQLVLGSFANNDIESNGNNTGYNVKYVVNGLNSVSSHTATSTVICSTPISAWYNNIVDKDGDGIVDVTYKDDEGNTVNNWIGSNEATNRKGGGYVKGSMFAASFVIPFKKVTGEQTLTLQIIKEGESNALISWKVNLPQNQVPSLISYFNGSSFASEASESFNTYSIVRNHLYSIGSKSKPGLNPDPDDPDKDPTPDPDPEDPDPNGPNDPQDLTKGQNLVLRVNHNWEVIYKMELE